MHWRASRESRRNYIQWSGLYFSFYSQGICWILSEATITNCREWGANSQRSWAGDRGPECRWWVFFPSRLQKNRPWVHLLKRQFLTVALDIGQNHCRDEQAHGRFPILQIHIQYWRRNNDCEWRLWCKELSDITPGIQIFLWHLQNGLSSRKIDGAKMVSQVWEMVSWKVYQGHAHRISHGSWNMEAEVHTNKLQGRRFYHSHVCHESDNPKQGHITARKCIGRSTGNENHEAAWKREEDQKRQIGMVGKKGEKTCR